MKKLIQNEIKKAIHDRLFLVATIIFLVITIIFPFTKMEFPSVLRDGRTGFFAKAQEQVERLDRNELERMCDDLSQSALCSNPDPEAIKQYVWVNHLIIYYDYTTKTYDEIRRNMVQSLMEQRDLLTGEKRRLCEQEIREYNQVVHPVLIDQMKTDAFFFESFTEEPNHIPTLAFILWLVSICAAVFLKEKTEGIEQSVYASVNGRKKLYAAKWIFVNCLCVLMCILVVIHNFVCVAIIYEGGIDFAAPIQSLEWYARSPYYLTFLGLLLVCHLGRLLCFLAVIGVLAWINAAFDYNKPMLLFVAAIVEVLTEKIMIKVRAVEELQQLWTTLCAWNPYGLISLNTLLSEHMTISLGGYLVDAFWVSGVLSIVIWLGGSALGFFAFGRRIGKKDRSLLSRLVKRGERHE